jgi:hypothetical protein
VDNLVSALAAPDRHDLEGHAQNLLAGRLADLVDSFDRERLIELEANLRALAATATSRLARTTLLTPLNGATLQNTQPFSARRASLVGAFRFKGHLVPVFARVTHRRA